MRSYGYRRDAEARRAQRVSEALGVLRVATGDRLAWAWHRPTGMILVTADKENAGGAAAQFAQRLGLALERSNNAAARGGEMGELIAKPLRVPIRFDEVPLEDLFDFFQNITQKEVVLNYGLDMEDFAERDVPELAVNPEVSLGVTLQLCLDLGRPSDVESLAWIVRGDKVVITMEPLLLTLQAFDAVPLAEALKRLNDLTDREISMDKASLESAGIDAEAFGKATISMTLPAGRPMGDALRAVVRQAHPNARIRLTPEGNYVVVGVK